MPIIPDALIIKRNTLFTSVYFRKDESNSFFNSLETLKTELDRILDGMEFRVHSKKEMSCRSTCD